MRLLLVLLLFLGLPAAIARGAYEWFNYKQGTGHVGETFSTEGFAPRKGNRVWHQAGKSWWVYYQHVDGSLGCIKFDDANPTHCGNPDGYAKSKCSNSDDNSGVTWTCQTTREIPSAPQTFQDIGSSKAQRPPTTLPFPMSVLSRARGPSDTLTGDARAEVESLMVGVPSQELSAGSVVVSASRRLLTGVGAAKGDFFVVPTSRGLLCAIVTGLSASGCFSSERLNSVGIDWGLSDNDGLGRGEPLVVDGLVDDRVASVDVVTGGRTVRALLANNAFYAEVSDAALPEMLIVRFRSGRQLTAAVPQLPTAEN